MKKIVKTLLASCLLCSAIAVGGVAIANAETGEENSRDLGYAPDITVDWGEYSSENIPNAVKGEAYRLFKASAEDVYGEEVAVSTKVYLHYLEETKSLVTLKENTVIPTHYGVYTVEYTAVDSFGNVAVETYNFDCEDTGRLSISLLNPQTATLVGTETQIADFVYENELGNVTTKITATHENGKIVYDLTDENAFYPMYVGNYTVEYVCNDYNLVVKDSYTLTVEENSNPEFFGRANVEKYFIVGQEYTLPSVEAYQFSMGKPISVEPIISVKTGKGKTRQLDGYTFTPEVAGEVLITYTIACGENKRSQEYVAQVVNVGEVGNTFDIAKYFYSSEASIEATDDYVSITTQREGARVNFVNTLSPKSVTFEFAITEEKQNFDFLNIYLQDSENEDVCLTLTYAYPNSENSYFCVDEGDKYSTAKYMSAVQTITYNDESKTVSFGGNFSAECPMGFEGFPSGKIYLSFEFSGVKGKTGLNVYSINNQVFFRTDGDYFAPQVWFEMPEKDLFTIGELVAIGKFYVCDVLDPNATLSLSVTSPSDEYVVSEEGILLNGYTGDTTNCTFRITEYGEYRLRIVVEDRSGNMEPFAYVMKCADSVPPTATLESKIPDKLKCGEVFTVSNLIIEDDVSAIDKCEIFVVLLGPKGDVDELSVGKSYKIQDAGTYYLYYMITDEAGNTVTISHTITVS